MKIKRGNWRMRECAGNVQATIDHYAARHSGDDETALTDLLADLMAWAYATRTDFDSALDCARHHFAVESQPGFMEGKEEQCKPMTWMQAQLRAAGERK